MEAVMKKGFFILVFMFFCLSALFAAELDIPFKAMRKKCQFSLRFPKIIWQISMT